MKSASSLKKSLKADIENPDWQDKLPEIISLGKKAIPALFSFLLAKPETRHRAAIALGQIIAAIAAENPEKGRDYIRQFMWRMNEDSGNIGWGIPEAFAETLAASPALAREYGHILISYIIDLGFADNFCDYAPLRRSCYWAVGRLAQCYPEMAEAKRHWLVKGLNDEDEICRGMAAWSLSMLQPELTAAPLLKKLIAENSGVECSVFENDRLETTTVGEICEKCLKKWNM